MEYFSDKERGLKARTEEVISLRAWGGIVATVESLISTGAFGQSFPKMCPDGVGPIGTDERALALAVKAEIPGLEWPLKTATSNKQDFFSGKTPFTPDTLAVLDLVQFCYMYVAKPIQDGYHAFFQHYHLSFDTKAGKDQFCTKINRIFSRNGIAYELQDDGNIIRLTYPVLQEELCSAVFDTGDGALDQILEEARRKFLDPDPVTRREAVERLWDAWERLKSIKDPSDKKHSITQLLDQAASESQFRALLEEEAHELTDIGNTFHIRHSEVTQAEIQESSHLDYLFHRLFCMIMLLLKAMRR